MYVDINIDIDDVLEQISNDDLREICINRGIDCEPMQKVDVKDLATTMYYAFYLGQHDRAIALAKQIAEQATGRIL